MLQLASEGYRRRLESIRKFTEVVADLLKQAKAFGIQAYYLFSTDGLDFPQ
jgi:hypothetical protein